MAKWFGKSMPKGSADTYSPGYYALAPRIWRGDWGLILKAVVLVWPDVSSTLSERLASSGFHHGKFRQWLPTPFEFTDNPSTSKAS